LYARELAVDLVKEDYAGLCRPSLFEEHPQLPLSFADPFTQDVRSFAHEEG